MRLRGPQQHVNNNQTPATAAAAAAACILIGGKVNPRGGGGRQQAECSEPYLLSASRYGCTSVYLCTRKEVAVAAQTSFISIGSGCSFRLAASRLADWQSLQAATTMLCWRTAPPLHPDVDAVQPLFAFEAVLQRANLEKSKPSTQVHSAVQVMCWFPTMWVQQAQSGYSGGEAGV